MTVNNLIKAVSLERLDGYGSATPGQRQVFIPDWPLFIPGYQVFIRGLVDHPVGIATCANVRMRWALEARRTSRMAHSYLILADKKSRRG
jgi:hypothetical protein